MRLFCCRVCNEPLPLGQEGPGRRPETCGDENSPCAQKWSNARRRAQRAKVKGLDALDRAMAAVSEINPDAHKRIKSVYKWLEKNNPKDLALLLERDLWE